ncbi:MAG: ABC transporter permease [Bacteroidetes bacterium]|nr:ABC transporter permease [Bacteroidota bacterium]MCL5026086.1 ABC transporter permease [Chloroflexota bacterium]
MDLLESLRMALRSLSANKLRASLTMLGMIIGVAAVIALMAIGQGAQASILDRIRGIGTNLLFVTPGSAQQGGFSFGAGSAPTLTLQDAQAIAADVPNIVAVAPEIDLRRQVVYERNNTNTRILGTTPEYQDVRNFHPVEGDFISQSDIDGRIKVASLGSTTAQTLFDGSDPVGQEIKVAGIDFRVIGLMETKGSQALGNQDDVVIVPLTTLAETLGSQLTPSGGLVVQTINVEVSDESLMPQATADISNLLLERHRVTQADFTIRSQEDTIAALQTVTQTFTLLLGAIAGISLVVGGIGIMNIMLVSVTERTREIGIRKALGAKRSDILVQFMIEAVVVSVMGGLMGVALGVGISEFTSGISLGGQPLRPLVTVDSIALAFGVSAGIGVFFGIYPASRAAALNPIDALRYE